MKVNDIKKFSTEEINKKILEKKEELFNLRFKQASGMLEKSHQLSEIRKDIARMKTVLRERELSEI